MKKLLLCLMPAMLLLAGCDKLKDAIDIPIAVNFDAAKKTLEIDTTSVTGDIVVGVNQFTLDFDSLLEANNVEPENLKKLYIRKATLVLDSGAANMNSLGSFKLSYATGESPAAGDFAYVGRVENIPQNITTLDIPVADIDLKSVKSEKTFNFKAEGNIREQITSKMYMHYVINIGMEASVVGEKN